MRNKQKIVMHPVPKRCLLRVVNINFRVKYVDSANLYGNGNVAIFRKLLHQLRFKFEHANFYFKTHRKYAIGRIRTCVPNFLIRPEMNAPY